MNVIEDIVGWTIGACALGVLIVCAFMVVTNLANAGGPRLKHLITTPNDRGNVWAFTAEIAPGLQVACVEAVHSGGLWCTPWEAEKEGATCE